MSVYLIPFVALKNGVKCNGYYKVEAEDWDDAVEQTIEDVSSLLEYEEVEVINEY